MSYQCRHCGAEITDSPCPECGKRGKKVSFKSHMAASTITSTVKLTVTREFWERCWPEIVLLAIIGVFSPFITSQYSGGAAVFVGLAFNVLSFILGFKAARKIKEIDWG